MTLLAHGQSRRPLLGKDKFSFSVNSYGKGMTSYRVGGGIPPLFFNASKSKMLLLNGSFSQTSINFSEFGQREFLEFSLLPIYIHRINRTWTFRSLLPISSAYEERESALRFNSLNFVWVTEWSKTFSSSGSSFGFGFAGIFRGEQVLVFPNLSFSFLNSQQNLRFRIGFPALSLDLIRNKSILGLFLAYEFDSFYFAKASSGADFLRSERLIAGVKIDFMATQHISIQMRAGQLLREDLFLADENVDRVDGGDLTRPGFEAEYLSFKMGYRF